MLHAFKQNGILLSVENNIKLLNKDALGISRLLTLFNYEETVSEIPFRPKGGDIFTFKNTAGRKDDWKADGHTEVGVDTGFHYFCLVQILSRNLLKWMYTIVFNFFLQMETLLKITTSLL